MISCTAQHFVCAVPGTPLPNMKISPLRFSSRVVWNSIFD